MLTPFKIFMSSQEFRDFSKRTSANPVLYRQTLVTNRMQMARETVGEKVRMIRFLAVWMNMSSTTGKNLSRDPKKYHYHIRDEGARYRK